MTNYFYRLPDDVYQTAKITKLLHLMETGKISEYKNKNLDEIEFDVNEVLLSSDDEVDGDDANSDQVGE